LQKYQRQGYKISKQMHMYHVPCTVDVWR